MLRTILILIGFSAPTFVLGGARIWLSHHRKVSSDKHKQDLWNDLYSHRHSR